MVALYMLWNWEPSDIQLLRARTLHAQTSQTADIRSSNQACRVVLSFNASIETVEEWLVSNQCHELYQFLGAERKKALHMYLLRQLKLYFSPACHFSSPISGLT